MSVRVRVRVMNRKRVRVRVMKRKRVRVRASVRGSVRVMKRRGRGWETVEGMASRGVLGKLRDSLPQEVAASRGRLKRIWKGMGPWK